MIDNSQQNALERIASFHDLRYKKLNSDEGKIGLITNGYGLSKATADLLVLMNGKVANYMDLTIASSIEDVLYGLDLLEYDSRVKVILFNIFGGGADVQRIAEAIMVAKKMQVFTKPIVIRIRGLHEKEANEHLREFMAEHGETFARDMYLSKEMDQAALQACTIAAESELSDLIRKKFTTGTRIQAQN